MPDTSHMPPERDELPSEFAHVHHLLLADSHAWEGRLPSADRLNHYAWQLEHAELTTAPAHHPSFLRPIVELLPKGQVPHTMTHSRARTLIPAVAVLIIVGLLGVVFTQIRAHGVASPSTTASQAAWEHLSQLDSTARFESNSPTALAPTDPQVVYQTFAQGAHSNAPNGNATMRRSDDGGQTWHALTFPVLPTHINYAGIEVSPLDAHTVLLAIFDTYGKEDCSSAAMQYFSDGNFYSCWLDYSSGDGGAHWAPIAMPFVDSGINPPVAVGTKLFAHVDCFDFSCSHLMSSADGGKTWQLADNDITAQMHGVCLVSAAATTLYAVASTGSCKIDQTTQRVVWQSNDAGAHWQRNGTMPGSTAITIVAVPTATTPLLYTLDSTTSLDTINGGNDTQHHITDVRVSADGGKTWVSAPTAGFPSGQKVGFDQGILGVLTDGRVIVQSIPQKSLSTMAGSTLVAWKQGATNWQQVAPPLTQDIGSLLVTPTNQSSQGTIWVVAQNRTGLPPGATPVPTAKTPMPPTPMPATTIIFTVLKFTK